MVQPFYFGRPQRSLFGIHHGTGQAADYTAAQNRCAALLICAPLLQEGICSQRAMWSLAEALASTGLDVLRFDWFGSGDSAGDSRDLAFAGLLEDLQLARSALCAVAPTAGTRVRTLALRSAALPLLAQAATTDRPVDLVLWEPQLLGSKLIAYWRHMHQQQLFAAGRYPYGIGVQAGPEELLGFEVGPALLAPLAALDACDLQLPAGSRVLLATWQMTEEMERFVANQEAAGATVQRLLFETADRPSYEDPQQFESLALPRRSVAQLARWLAAEGGG